MTNASDKDISNSRSNLNAKMDNINMDASSPSFLPSPSASESSTHNNESQNIIHSKLPMTLASKSIYTSNGRSLKTLLILCQGMMDNEGHPIADLSDLPWSSARAKNTKLTVVDLRNEVKRLACIFDDVVITPHPKAWTANRAMEWLKKHPISNENDVTFIKNTIAD